MAHLPRPSRQSTVQDANSPDEDCSVLSVSETGQKPASRFINHVESSISPLNAADPRNARSSRVIDKGQNNFIRFMTRPAALLCSILRSLLLVGADCEDKYCYSSGGKSAQTSIYSDLYGPA